jgi:hypothetical protein
MKPIQIKVGGTGPYDPTVGTTDCIIDILKGAEAWITKTGYGPYPYEQYSILSSGGFRLIGSTFEQDEIWFVHSSGFLISNDAGSYSNGFNYSVIMAAMFGRLGWRASTQPGQPVLNSNNQTSRSGRFFNDVHALLTIPNIKSVMDSASMTDAEFNAELESLQKSNIIRFLTAVFGGPELIEQVMLYEREEGQDVTIPNEGLFVGYEIEIANDIHKAVQIESAVLHFDNNVTFPLYLFKDGNKTPVWVQNVSAVKDESTIINIPDLVLNYISQGNKGSTYYFGYFQDDLGSVKAYRNLVDEWNETLIFSAEPFQSKKITGETNFDRRYYNELNVPHGMNLQMSSFNDWSATIVKKANIFDELNALSMAYTVIEKIIYTTRINATETILKDGMSIASAIQDLTGQAPVSDGPPSITGLNKRIEREIVRVKKSLFPEANSQNINLC